MTTLSTWAPAIMREEKKGRLDVGEVVPSLTEAYQTELTQSLHAIFSLPLFPSGSGSKV